MPIFIFSCRSRSRIAKDVRYYLISRYGLEISTEDIQKMVFQDLAGGCEDTDCIDICELVAMLLIPFFAKVRVRREREREMFYYYFLMCFVLVFSGWFVLV